jgi:hypothetical protein
MDLLQLALLWIRQYGNITMVTAVQKHYYGYGSVIDKREF